MDTDAAGHHHNTAVMRWVESAEAALMRERGLAGYFGSAPRVRHEVDFESRLWFGQEVTATVVLERIGTSSMAFTYEVWGGEFDGRPRARAAKGRYVTVHVPEGAESSRPWPEEWRSALA
jgi:acyl-CoA thioester hydrolase